MKTCISFGLGLLFILVAGGIPTFERPAFAQTNQADQQFIARLNELTRRKGYQNFTIGIRVCQTLGLKPIGQCEVFQAPYDDSDKITHAINTFDEPGTGVVRIIISKTDERTFSEAYLVGLDGALKRAAEKRVRGGVSAWLAISRTAAVAGLERELAFWRTKLAELEGESDRCSEKWKAEHPNEKC